MKLKSFALTIFTVGIATISVSKAQAASFQVVADGLDNSRNMAFDKDGNLYVTESGHGGDGKDGRCIASPSSQYIPLCAGENGAVVKIAPDGTRTNVLSGLTSIALTPSGEQAAGPADFKFDSQGNAYLLTGVAGNPNERDTVLKAPDLGKLYKVDLNTKQLTPLADLAAYEAKYNPDGTDLISNPYAFAIKGDNAYVVDGGGNTIYKVALDGSGIKDVKAFAPLIVPKDQLQYPNVPGGITDPTGGAPLPPGYVIGNSGLPASQQSVPTGIAQAPDGTFTVSEYSYFPYPEGKARLWSVDDNLTTTGTGFSGAQLTGTEVATGFTELTGVAYDADGNEFVLQHMNQSEWKGIQQGGIITGDIGGSLIEILKDGTRQTIWSGDGLEIASGITVGPDGHSLYISNRTRLAGQSQIIKIDPTAPGTKVPEPSAGLGLLAVGALGASAAVRKRMRQEKVGSELLAKVETF